jgi:hypothetical protein
MWWLERRLIADVGFVAGRSGGDPCLPGHRDLADALE